MFKYDIMCIIDIVFFFSSRRRHTRLQGDWSSDVCSSDLCATPTSEHAALVFFTRIFYLVRAGVGVAHLDARGTSTRVRSEERRVGKECRARRAPAHEKKYI